MVVCAGGTGIIRSPSKHGVDLDPTVRNINAKVIKLKRH